MLKRIIRGLKQSRSATRGGLVFLAASLLVNGANFFYHLIISRRLEIDDYGALGALLGLLLIFAVPAAALQVAVTKEVATRRDPDRPNSTPVEIGPLLAQSVLWGLGTTLVLLAFAPLLQKFLHLQSISTAVLVALYAIPSALGVVPRGVLLGELRFTIVAFSMVIGAAVRLGLGVVLSSSNGLSGAVAAILVGDLVAVAILLPALRRFVGAAQDKPLRIHWKEGTAAIVAFSGFWAMTGIDTLLARHFLERHSSGQFAAAATAARAAMFLPTAIASVAFPRFAVGAGRSEAARIALVRALAIVTVLSLSIAIVLVVLDEFVIRLLFGERYLEATEALIPLALAAAALGVVSVLMHFHIASNARMAAALPWAGVAGSIAGIIIFHESMFAIGLVMLVVSTIVLLLMLYIAFSRRANDHTQWVGRELFETPDRSEYELTMVVPYYNPGANVVDLLKRLDLALRESNATYEIIAVSDGSTDGSEKLVAEANIESVRPVVVENNMGKGHALRVGLAMGRGRYLGFIDADGDVDPALLAPYLSIVKLYEPDIILGSKRHPMSDVEYPPLRHVYSWGYQMLTYLLFRTKVRDTQTGLKLIRRDVLAAALPLMVEKRFAFDLELLVVARHLGFKKFFEAPIKIDFQFKSTVSVRSVRGMMLDTFAIFYRLHMLRSYDVPEQQTISRPLAL